VLRPVKATTCLNNF